MKSKSDLDLIIIYQSHPELRVKNKSFTELIRRYESYTWAKINTMYQNSPIIAKLGLDKNDMYSELIIQFQKAIVYIKIDEVDKMLARKKDRYFGFSGYLDWFFDSWLCGIYRYANAQKRKSQVVSFGDLTNIKVSLSHEYESKVMEGEFLDSLDPDEDQLMSLLLKNGGRNSKHAIRIMGEHRFQKAKSNLEKKFKKLEEEVKI
jgi:hypothetical protein